MAPKSSRFTYHQRDHAYCAVFFKKKKKTLQISQGRRNEHVIHTALRYLDRVGVVHLLRSKCTFFFLMISLAIRLGRYLFTYNCQQGPKDGEKLISVGHGVDVIPFAESPLHSAYPQGSSPRSKTSQAVFHRSCTSMRLPLASVGVWARRVGGD